MTLQNFEWLERDEIALTGVKIYWNRNRYLTRAGFQNTWSWTFSLSKPGYKYKTGINQCKNNV